MPGRWGIDGGRSLPLLKPIWRADLREGGGGSVFCEFSKERILFVPFLDGSLGTTGVDVDVFKDVLVPDWGSSLVFLATSAGSVEGSYAGARTAYIDPVDVVLVLFVVLLDATDAMDSPDSCRTSWEDGCCAGSDGASDSLLAGRAGGDPLVGRRGGNDGVGRPAG